MSGSGAEVTASAVSAVTYARETGRAVNESDFTGLHCHTFSSALRLVQSAVEKLNRLRRVTAPHVSDEEQHVSQPGGWSTVQVSEAFESLLHSLIRDIIGNAIKPKRLRELVLGCVVECHGNTLRVGSKNDAGVPGARGLRSLGSK